MPKVKKTDIIGKKLKPDYVAAVGAFRTKQAKNAVYRAEGDEFCGYIAGAKIARILLPMGQPSAKIAASKAQSALEPIVAKYGEFTLGDVLKVTATESEFIVISKDGRKYRVDIETGEVS